jgi:hypothetical protein
MDSVLDLNRRPLARCEFGAEHLDRLFDRLALVPASLCRAEDIVRLASDFLPSDALMAAAKLSRTSRIGFPHRSIVSRASRSGYCLGPDHMGSCNR